MPIEIRTQPSLAIRPIGTGLVLAAGIALAGVILEAVDNAALEMLLVPAVLVFLFCVGRAGLWLVLAGRVRVIVSDEHVVLMHGRRTVVYPRSLVDSVRIEGGEAWPEWSRWALLPRVVVRLRDAQSIPRKILLSRERVGRANRELCAAIPGTS